jgi:tetratricopeptide (TPR) repeat protein
MGELEKAEEAALRSLRVIRTIPDTRREEATSLINLGEVQSDMGRYDEAESSLNEAMRIFETEFNGKDIHYAYAAAACGALEYYRKNWDRSIEHYKKAMELVERDFGRSPYYDMLENNLRIVQEAKSGEAKS